MGKLILIIGGARSGKSTYAQQLAQKSSNKVAFIATAQALDEDMANRIDNHKKTRPSDWITIEASIGVSQKYRDLGLEMDVVIVDCLTLLVSNFMMKEMDNAQIDMANLEFQLKQEINELISTARGGDTTWIVVTNEVGLGIVPGDSLSRNYRDILGRVNQWVASVADEVIYMVAGIPIPITQYRLT